MMMFSGQHWYAISDGDPRGRAMVNRHYSGYHYKDGRKPKLFIGPGEKHAYMTSDGLALFVWRKFIDDSGQVGVNCAVFRNEGPELSSSLILEAEQLAWNIWPGERLYTYVNPSRIKSKNPGCCFKKAGWVFCGYTKGGLMIFEKLSAECFR
jgi:hypothetical protein